MSGEKKEFKPDYKISILIPSRGYCNMAFAIALKNLNMPPMTSLQTLYLVSCFIDTMRNDLVGHATQDWLLFMDDDVLPPPNGLIQLLERDKDIITGLYFHKQQPHFPQIYKANEKDPEKYDAIWDYDKAEPFQVDACGAGFLLIKRDVFNKVSLPWFKYETDENGHRAIGEDMYFSRKAKEAGYEIWCDPTVVCQHVGQTFIGPQFWDISRNQLEEMKKKMSKNEWDEFLKNTQN